MIYLWTRFRSQGNTNIMTLRHKRDIESAIQLSSPEINSMLKVNSDNAIYQRIIVRLEDCFLNNKLQWSVLIVKGRSLNKDYEYMHE